MAQVIGTTDTFDLIGLAEDVEDMIWNISPSETPCLSMFKREKVTNVNHQWQTDSLAAAAANRYVEGDDSTYATASPTTMLSNYTQISKKTVMVSGTADAVGRAQAVKTPSFQRRPAGIPSGSIPPVFRTTLVGRRQTHSDGTQRQAAQTFNSSMRYSPRQWLGFVSTLTECMCGVGRVEDSWLTLSQQRA